MTGAVRVAALFMGYGALGMGGDYAVGLLGHDTAHNVVVVDVMEAVDGVDVMVDVQVRNSGECAFMVDREVSVAASLDDVLQLRHGSGELQVQGREGLDEVRATGVACASHEEFIEDLTLSVERIGSEIHLSASYPESRNWRGNRTAKLDLVVEIPLHMAVDLDDSSGSLEVMGTGDLRIDDSSGSITVGEISGDVSIRDGSGGVGVFDITGSLSLEDGSGSIDVSNVGGGVEIRDGSGSMEINAVGGDVSLSDGSGSIQVRDVAGNLSVPSDGSGSIRHSDIRGTVSVPQKRRR